MTDITVITREGTDHVVAGAADLSVMEAIRSAGFDELLAICGGCCSCATCHVYVEQGGDGLAPVSADEDDLLDSSLYRQPNSRLSCQMRLADVGAGLTVRIAPEE